MIGRCQARLEAALQVQQLLALEARAAGGAAWQRLAEQEWVVEPRTGIAAFELGAGQDYLSDLGPRLLAHFRERDLLVRPMGNSIYVMPPYSITPEQLARIVGSQPAGAEPRQVMLRADTALDYGRVMRVMGELNRAGLNRVALVSTQGDAP